MQILWLDQEMIYDGTQLAPHYIYRNYRLQGDGVIAFAGPADVRLGHMVDWADVLENAPIYSPRMLHFLIEHFNTDLELAVCRQRLFICIVKEVLADYRVMAARQGDDLYLPGGKLSVSIATASTVSTLIHIGLNIETEGTPVATAGLAESGITGIKEFALLIMQKYQQELEQSWLARCKVRGRESAG